MIDDSGTIFRVIPHIDKDEWLAEKQHRISATDITSIRSGSLAVFNTLKKKKDTPTGEQWKGNMYTEWGHEREPIIADYVSSRIMANMLPNENFLVRKDNDKFGATPDMVYVGDDGEVITGQIKTTIKDWGTVDKIPASYYTQCQWEMFITGADRCIFVWEPYAIDDDGDFIPHLIKHDWIERDDEIIQDLVDTANAYLDYEQPEIEEIDEDFDLAMIVQELADVEEALAEANARAKGLAEIRDNLRADLLHVLGEEEKAVTFGGFTVEVSSRKGSSRFDRKSFEADHPGLIKDYLIKSDDKPTLKISAPDSV